MQLVKLLLNILLLGLPSLIQYLNQRKADETVVNRDKALRFSDKLNER